MCHLPQGYYNPSCFAETKINMQNSFITISTRISLILYHVFIFFMLELNAKDAELRKVRFSYYMFIFIFMYFILFSPVAKILCVKELGPALL